MEDRTEIIMGEKVSVRKGRVISATIKVIGETEILLLPPLHGFFQVESVYDLVACHRNHINFQQKIGPE